MAHWLQKLETAWARRYARGRVEHPEEEGRFPVCIITGGSEGIGRHLADQFAQGGHRLVLVARNATNLESAAAELRSMHGIDVYTVAADLTEPDYLSRIQAVLDRHALYTDIVVNNAGVGLGGPFMAQDQSQLAEICRLNMEALTILTRAFLPSMLKRARGGILNIASLGGLLPGPYQAVYYASKAYVVSLTEALAYENAGQGVRICVAAPGPVATRFHERMGVRDAHYLNLLNVMPPERAAQMIYSGFMGGGTIVVPGIMPSVNAFFVRYIPHFILVPFIGWLLKQRY